MVDRRRSLDLQPRCISVGVHDAGLNGAYGYLWWVSRHGLHWPGVLVPEGTYSARGWRGHRLVVVPPLDLVVVLRVDTTRPGPEVTATQFGRLFRMLLDAAPANAEQIRTR